VVQDSPSLSTQPTGMSSHITTFSQSDVLYDIPSLPTQCRARNRTPAGCPGKAWHGPQAPKSHMSLKDLRLIRTWRRVLQPPDASDAETTTKPFSLLWTAKATMSFVTETRLPDVLSDRGVNHGWKITWNGCPTLQGRAVFDSIVP